MGFVNDTDFTAYAKPAEPKVEKKTPNGGETAPVGEIKNEEKTEQ